MTSRRGHAEPGYRIRPAAPWRTAFIAWTRKQICGAVADSTTSVIESGGGGEGGWHSPRHWCREGQPAGAAALRATRLRADRGGRAGAQAPMVSVATSSAPAAHPGPLRSLERDLFSGRRADGGVRPGATWITRMRDATSLYGLPRPATGCGMERRIRGMIPIETYVDLEDTTYRVSSGRPGPLKRTGS